MLLFMQTSCNEVANEGCARHTWWLVGELKFVTESLLLTTCGSEEYFLLDEKIYLRKIRVQNTARDSSACEYIMTVEILPF